ncbi:Regulator of G protein signalling-like domain [Nesidiocoris tenuis]|uniref:Regulator of G protein signalling-like domain n=1 Tax=Nesidiocoris tenuis TaxID=355587 RepID=A0ABN7AAT1_9HEMI|nr:Regulator of G protein signalling-like domain [Nesidiocoris tenuis]
MELLFSSFKPEPLLCDKRAEAQVILTVQQSPLPLRERSGSTVMPSPSLLRQPSCQSRDRITAPQPVDNEKLRQFEYQKAHTLKLMLEKEQRYVESLRSKRAKCNDSGTEARILQDLQGAERRILTLQTQLEQEGMEPPPLPTRSRHSTLSPPPPARPHSSASSPSSPFSTPPPLPPRQYLLLSPGDHLSPSTPPGANQVHTHQRTKSSPDTMSPNAALAEASKRLIASESMSELSIAKRSKGGVAWEVDRPTSPSTPPGTPPPPYNMGFSAIDETVYSHIPEEDSPPRGEVSTSETDHAATSPTKNFNFLAPGSPPIQQQPIISMEDEDMSDQEMSQMEDHGPFKRWNELSKHQAHLAVFLNYVISNSDPSSILFYLVTDLYKEGSAKEMKKWAYEIHSSFLVPGAPLRLNNVDENVAREIDEVLLKESDKEEILRKIFWKARQKAKEELNEQLADFQAKRTAGLGTLFGPKDAELEESIHDKNKEMRIIESVLVPKLEPYLEDIEKGNVDDRRFTAGAALGTVLSKVFGIRGQHFNSLLERCPTYVSKDKSLKAKLIGKTRKVSTRGHHCIAHQYYLVTYCNHCQLIIWGIGPQGYQCSNCGLNIHRHCVNVIEENCPGPMTKKERGNDRISKLMDRIRPENARRKPSSLNLSQVDRSKRVPEEPEPPDHETGAY